MQKMKMKKLAKSLTFAEGQEEYIRDCKVRNLRVVTIWTELEQTAQKLLRYN